MRQLKKMTEKKWLIRFKWLFRATTHSLSDSLNIPVRFLSSYLLFFFLQEDFTEIIWAVAKVATTQAMVTIENRL